MKRHTRHSALSVRRTLLLIVLGCLLAGGLAGAIFQPGSAAQDDSLRLNPKGGSSAHTIISQTQTSQDDLTEALHSPAEDQSRQFAASPFPSGQVIESDGGQAVCRNATEEEARVMRQRDSEQPLRTINHEESAALTGAQTQAGLKIILRGTPQLEQFPAAKAAFIRAAAHWESVIQSPITVIIDVDFGPTRFGEAFPPSTIGSTDSQDIGGSSVYPSVRTALIARASNAQEAALYNVLPQAQLPTDLGATAGMFGPTAVLRAMGVINPVADPDGERERFGPPPSIGFNSGFQFDFDPSDGIDSGKTDFDATATHEIGHALGFTSNAGLKELVPSAPVGATPWDLFRFRPGITTTAFSTAPRILSSGGEQVFFGGGTALALSTGRPDGTGGDGRQGSHWKDDAATGRYIGIMDPTLPAGRREEITENDLKALDLMGYQLKANPNPTPTPTPNPQTVELKLDDGTQETGAYANGLIVVNRLTPPSYPATLQKLRFLFWPFQNQPDPTGKPIALVIFTDPNGTGQPPTGAQITRINTTVPGTSLSNFFEVNIPNGPTISSGDFYVGFQAPSPHQGVGFFLDTSGQSPNRCFYSSNNGAGFSLLAPALNLNSANAMIRAVVSTGGATPTPTPVPTPGGNTVALTSGAPQTGAIPAPQQPGGGVLGETQYTIQVPSGATQLKVNLSGNQDVDLLVRFGNRVVIQDGAPVADFKSESATGDESVTITAGSSPALQAGVYYIAVANFGSAAASFIVTATVSGGVPQPTPTPTPTAGNRVVRIGQAGGAPGGTVNVPIELAAQGDENALGFSLNFDPAVLSNPQAALGSDATGAALNTNTGQIGSGRLGIALSLPSGQKFSAGTRQIVIVTFAISGGATASSTQVGFGDQPVAREISDSNARALQSAYTPGAVALTSGFEADVAPRPNGNGSVTITDWVQIGRFVAGQDAPSAGERQRADCAPRETRGNGGLTITDWVQAGRYAAGLDAPTSAGGPSGQDSPGLTAGLQHTPADAAAGSRIVRISSGYFERGQQSSVIIELGAEGNENALGFSLSFDPAQLRFISASAGKDANGATLNVNASQAAKGRVGVALALPAGQRIKAGPCQVIVINFAVAAEGGAATAAISFGDQPVARELSDASANSLPVSFNSGTVTLTRSVTSVSAASFTGQPLASEVIAAAFGQNLATHLAVADTLPLPTLLAGTTVRVRDSAGEERLAPLFFVAPAQINYQIPEGVAAGEAMVTIRSGDGQVSTGTINIAAIAPGLFSASASGQGLAAAVALRVKADGTQSYEPIVQYDARQQRLVALPIELGPDLGNASDQVFLLLFGTGFRHQRNLASVKVELGAMETEALFAGPQGGFAGLDQLNLRIPRSLAGSGVVDVMLNVDGHESNRVQVHIK